MRLALAVPAALLFPSAIVLVRPDFFSMSAQALNMPPWSGALAFFIASATTEEAAKAAAIGVADLRRTLFSWFWVTVAIAGLVGLSEIALQHLLYFAHQGYPPQFGLLAFANMRTIAGHIALSLLCVALARMMGGSLWAWLGAIAVVGLLHSAVNFGRRGLFGALPGGPSLYLILTAVLFIAAIVLAYLCRRRLDWRL